MQNTTAKVMKLNNNTQPTMLMTGSAAKIRARETSRPSPKTAAIICRSLVTDAGLIIQFRLLTGRGVPWLVISFPPVASRREDYHTYNANHND